MRALLSQHPRSDFIYADAFSGYAASPLVRNYGWEDGAHLFAQKFCVNNNDDQLLSNEDLKIFAERYLRSAAPQDSVGNSLVAGVWPGSSLIAFDACKAAGFECSLNLFDISLAVVANLRGVFREQDCTVIASPASPSSPLVRGADLLFIDPPGIRSYRDRSAPSWKSVLELARAPVKACVLWLPVLGQDMRVQDKQTQGESVESASWREELLAEGWRSYRVQWQNSGTGMIGTQLIWRLPDDAGDRIMEVTRRLCNLGFGQLM
jgi:hypothetical protein